MPALWAENTPAWETWITLTELAGPQLTMSDIESWARVNGLNAAPLARKLAAVQSARTAWIKSQSTESES